MQTHALQINSPLGDRNCSSELRNFGRLEKWSALKFCYNAAIGRLCIRRVEHNALRYKSHSVDQSPANELIFISLPLFDLKIHFRLVYMRTDVLFDPYLIYQIAPECRPGLTHDTAVIDVDLDRLLAGALNNVLLNLHQFLVADLQNTRIVQ